MSVPWPAAAGQIFVMTNTDASIPSGNNIYLYGGSDATNAIPLNKIKRNPPTTAPVSIPARIAKNSHFNTTMTIISSSLKYDFIIFGAVTSCHTDRIRLLRLRAKVAFQRFIMPNGTCTAGATSLTAEIL